MAIQDKESAIWVAGFRSERPMDESNCRYRRKESPLEYLIWNYESN